MARELTKRKGVYASSESETDADSLLSMTPTAGNDDVRVVEYDIRPSCVNEPPHRYITKGDSLIPMLNGVAVAQKSMLTNIAACFTITGMTRELKEMFLPAGYPDSVSEDYLTFQFWDTIQAMCSYLRGVLATQSVLQSVGVGDDTATPLAAALQWVLRDGSGMIGGLTFAYIVGPKFDLNVKRWRLFADVINDVGLTLDMIAPFFPALVTEVLCVSSICKTMCGVAAGATRSSLMTHFAKRDNMADCAAKEGSQETAVKLFGLVFGMYFANAVNSSTETVWVAFIALTLLHMYANYNAVSGLCIPTLNRQRALILIERYLKFGANTKNAKEGNLMIDQIDRFSIRSVNAIEPVFCDPELPISRIHMGSQLYQAIPSHQGLDRLIQLYSDESYLLTVANEDVHVVFCAEMKPIDELRAFFQAVLVLHELKARPMNDTSSSKHELIQITYEKMCTEFSFFYQHLQRTGWRTHMFLLNTSTWRIKMNDFS